MNWKEWLQLIGLGSLLTAGGVLGIIVIVLAGILATAGPVVLVIWVVWKLFFN